jgi:hypothetical protein
MRSRTGDIVVLPSGAYPLVVAGAVLLTIYKKPLVEWITEKLDPVDSVDSGVVRRYMEEYKFQNVRTDPANPHVRAADARTSASKMIAAAIGFVGRRRFGIQHHIREGCYAGIRHRFWPKDCHFPPLDDRPVKGHDVIATMDVVPHGPELTLQWPLPQFHYLPMPRRLTSEVTVMAEEAEGEARTEFLKTNGKTWWFNRDGTLRLGVEGTTGYDHPIYDFNVDYLVLPKVSRSKSLFGAVAWLWNSWYLYADIHVVYKVIRKRQDDAHIVVFFNPMCNQHGARPEDSLKHFNPVQEPKEDSNELQPWSSSKVAKPG